MVSVSRFRAKPSTIRLMLIPLNMLCFMLVLSCMGLSLAQMPVGEYVVFALSFVKPLVVTVLAVSTSTFVTGILGTVKYDRCLMIVMGVLLLFCSLIGGVALHASLNIHGTLATFIPALINDIEYAPLVEDAAKELNCYDETGKVVWEDFEGRPGCKTLIIGAVGDFPTLCATLCTCASLALLICGATDIIFAVLVEVYVIGETTSNPNSRSA